MPQLATAVLAYFTTVAVSVAAAAAHPWFDVESHFVKAVSEFTTVAMNAVSLESLPEPTPLKTP